MEKKDQKKELSGCQRFLNIIIVIAILVYSFVNLGIVSNSYRQLNENVEELNDIVVNWQTGAIQEIRVASTCPNGYESATQNWWPGTKKGCWCGAAPESDLKAKNITCAPFCENYCSDDARSVGCLNVAENNAKAMPYLGIDTATNTNLLICVKRSKETWAERAIPSSSGACPTGYLNCSKSVENLFCTKEAKCPITSITISNINPTAVADCSNSPDNCAILTNDGISDIKQITWTRESVDSLPLVEFRLNEYSMCKIKNQNNINPGRPTYFLLNEKPDSCGTEGLNKWTVSDTINEEKLFDLNNLTATISGLNSYPTSSMAGYYLKGASGKNYGWSLFSRNYIPWKISCRDRFATFMNKKSFVDDVRMTQATLVGLASFTLIFFGIPLAYMQIQNFRGKSVCCICGKGEEQSKRLKRVKRIINYSIKGLQLPFQIWAIYACASAKALLTDLSDESCSDPETNRILLFLANSLTKTFSSTLIALGLLVAMALFDLIMDARESRKARKEREAAIGSTSPSVSPIYKEEHLHLTNIDQESCRSITPRKVSSTLPTQVYPLSSFNRPQTITIQLAGVQPSGPGFGYPQPQPYALRQYHIPQQQSYLPQYLAVQQQSPQQYPLQQISQEGYPPEPKKEKRLKKEKKQKKEKKEKKQKKKKQKKHLDQSED